MHAAHRSEDDDVCESDVSTCTYNQLHVVLIYKYFTVTFPFQLRTNPEEYGLSKDVDVSLWLDCRAYHWRPTLRESKGFIIIDGTLHKEYKEFQAEKTLSDMCFLPQNELLRYWCKRWKLTSTRTVEKYGRKYIKLFGHEGDELCAWVRAKRDLVDQEGWETEQDPQLDKDHSDEKPDCEITRVQVPAEPMSKLKRRQQKQLQKRSKHPKLAKTRKKFELSQSDVDIVRDGRMLTDAHMTAANQLLKRQFPSIRGLQSMLSGQDISFNPVETPFIQIVHVGSLHWATVEACHDSHVRVYDSLYSAVSSSTQTQVASIMRSKKSSVTFAAERTQYQQGGTDCGLFAIAFATHLCYGNNPAAYRYV